MNLVNPPRNTIFCGKCRSLSPNVNLHIKHKPDEIPEDLLKRYNFLEVIGVGSFGPVFKCWDIEKEKNKAIKIIFDIDYNFSFDFDSIEKLKHHFFIKYYEYEMKIEKDWAWAWMSTKLADMNLDAAIKKNIFDTEEKKVKLFKEICEGVAYLHTSIDVKSIELFFSFY